MATTCDHGKFDDDNDHEMATTCDDGEFDDEDDQEYGYKEYDSKILSHEYGYEEYDSKIIDSFNQLDLSCEQDSPSFEQCYRCSPLHKTHYPDAGNRIIMPPSALDHLMSVEIDYPMLFELENLSSRSSTHCGVLEFSGEEGFVLLPSWMMKMICLQEGQLVTIKNASLPKGEYMKIQPHTTDFTRLPNPKELLEKKLRGFSCVTTGDTILISDDNGQQYFIDILDTKPFTAISLVETDCKVDFAQPLDYKEAEKKLADGNIKSHHRSAAEGKPSKEEVKFKPFTGIARRLDGLPTSTVTEELPIMAIESNSSSRKMAGRIMFDKRNSDLATKTSVDVAEDNAKEKSAKKFEPFTGKKYTLGSLG